MSLFQAREWWDSRPDSPEECDKGCLCVCNIDNEAPARDKIITGSFQGILRIFYPRQAAFRIEDLMLEKRLDYPIIQLTMGRFIPSSSDVALAVLHPSRLVVYSVNPVSIVQGRATFYELVKVYEHKLARIAFNMVAGQFGGVYGKEFICVQSIDGLLSFFEQELVGFSRQLENFLVPGPLCYLPKSDSLVVATASMEVESYKYQVLGQRITAAGTSAVGSDKRGSLNSVDEDEKNSAGPSAAAAAGRLRPDWSANIGEHVVDLHVTRCSRDLAVGQSEIVVIGEHTLFALSETGAIRWQRLLDYNPAASAMFPEGDPAVVSGKSSFANILVCTHQNSMMVFREAQLVWAARRAGHDTSHAVQESLTQDARAVPVGIAVGTFADVQGMVVTLDDACNLQITFMGTDPPVHSLASAEESKDAIVDDASLDAQHRRLLKAIRDAVVDANSEPVEKLILSVQVPDRLDNSVDAGLSAGASDDDLRTAAERQQAQEYARVGANKGLISLTVKLYLRYTGSDNIKDIRINVDHPPAFFLATSSISDCAIESLSGDNKTPLCVRLQFRTSAVVIPSSLGVSVSASYLTAKDEPRLASCSFLLPLCSACRVVPPLKTTAFMFTLDTNKDPPSLMDVFADVLAPAVQTHADIQRTAPNVLSVSYYAKNEDATILVSKKAGRYRIQGSSLEALCVLSHELVRRLSLYYRNQWPADEAKKSAGASEPLVFGFTENLPLHDLFVAIDEHFQVRKALETGRSDLDKLAHQYRAVQKRLLARFKDKNPSSLNNMDLLLKETYERILQRADVMVANQQSLRLASNKLSCIVRIVTMLIRFAYKLDETNGEVLEQYLPALVTDSADQGWEDTTDAGLLYLLRTTLAKNAMEAAPAAGSTEPLQDTTKLKKHIQVVVDRIAKGMPLYKEPVKKLKPGAAAATGDP